MSQSTQCLGSVVPLTMFKTKSARFLRLLNQHSHMQMTPTPDMINEAQTLMETKISPTDCDQWMGCVTRDERPFGHLGLSRRRRWSRRRRRRRGRRAIWKSPEIEVRPKHLNYSSKSLLVEAAQKCMDLFKHLVCKIKGQTSNCFFAN